MALQFGDMTGEVFFIPGEVTSLIIIIIIIIIIMHDQERS